MSNRIEADRVRAEAAKISSVGEDLREAWQTLAQGGQGLGTPWGSEPDDKIGKPFAEGYLKGCDAAAKAFAELATAMQDTGKGLAESAATWEGSDRNNAHRLGGGA